MFEEAIQIVGLKRVLEMLYLEGWSSTDEQYGGILLGILRWAVNLIPKQQVRLIVRYLSEKPHAYCTADQLALSIYSSEG